MKYFVLDGGHQLRGKVIISGSKNASLPILSATLLTDDFCFIQNIPDLIDIRNMKVLLSLMGAKVIPVNSNSAKINCKNINNRIIDPKLYGSLRASTLLIGPLLARFHKIILPLKSGGCPIGERLIDIHLQGFKELGATIHPYKGTIEISCDYLKGNNIYLRYPSVGATENLLMAATLAEGKTMIQNAAREPEVVDLASFLNKMGANIIGAGTDTIKIHGVSELRGTSHQIIPDRIEAGTFMIAAMITRGDLTLFNVLPDHSTTVIDTMKAIGGEVIIEDDERIRVIGCEIKATDIAVLPYPGFPTDLQPPATTLLCVASGKSVINETVFENRFFHIPPLKQMGAKIHIIDREIVIDGVQQLRGTNVEASSIRAGASLILAGLIAKGRTRVGMAEVIERGYEGIQNKLTCLGAKIFLS